MGFEGFKSHVENTAHIHVPGFGIVGELLACYHCSREFLLMVGASGVEPVELCGSAARGA